MRNTQKNLWIYSLAVLAVLFVIGVGAYTRIADAGLGCPDWPGCYGSFIPPEKAQAAARSYSIQSFDKAKAWIEMFHRYLAGGLGLVLIGLSYQQIHKRQNQFLAGTIIAFVLIQANLGRLTVTMKLQPWIVTFHLLGGFLLLFLTMTLSCRQSYALKLRLTSPPVFRIPLFILTLLYLIQVFLGAWVSSNYAGLACQHFPGCSTEGFLTLNLSPSFYNAFSLWSVAEPLSYYSWSDKQMIHMIHRLNGLIFGTYLFYFGRRTWSHSNRRIRLSYCFLVFLFLAQISIAIALVVLRLPVALATLHNLIAALMGMAIIDLFFATRQSSYVAQRGV